MAIQTHKRAPGTPTWMHLMTPDLEAAKQFYRQLFGWTYLDTGPDFGHYHFARARDHDAAGLAGMQPDDQMPSAWTIYLASDDVAADAARVADLGGQVMVPPMEVGDTGSMAICVDPTGAVFGLWQAGRHTGASIVNEPGAMTWFEVNTPNAEAARNFYNQLFGLTAHKMEGMDYYTLHRGDETLFGVLQMDENWQGIPPHWMGYFAVDDTDASLKRLQEADGSVRVPPFDTPYGRMAVVADPFGATFSIIQLTKM